MRASRHRAFRFLRGNYGRLGLTVIALATGVASVCSNSMMSRAVMGSFADAVDAAVGTAALHVRRGDAGTFPKQVAIDVARVPGIAQVVPVLTATAFTSDGSGELLAVHAYDLVDDAAAEVYGVKGGTSKATFGAPVLLPGSLILTQAFAQRHGFVKGNRIKLDTPTGRQTFTVAGLIDATGLGRLNGGNLIVMDLYAAQVAFARPGEINRVDIAVAPEASPDQVAERIRAVLPPGMLAESPAEQKRVLENATQSIHQLLRVFMVGGLLAAFLIAFNSLSTLCEARVWELSVLRAIGMRQWAVWRQLVMEGLAIGMVGVIIGVPLGLAYGRAMLPRIADAAALDTNAVPQSAQLSLDPASVALAVALGLLTAVLAAALPAWRAARVEVVETIRNRGLEQGEPGTRPSGMVSVLVAVAAVLAVGCEVNWKSGPWGIIAASLVILATALLARPFTAVLGATLAARFGRFTGPTTRLALQQLTHRPRRASLMVAMIGIGVGSVLWLWTLAGSFEQSVVDTLTHSCRADLIVSSAHIGSAIIEAPVSDALLGRLTAIAGVAAVAGIRNAEVEYAGGTIMLDADDPGYFLQPAFGRLLLAEQVPGVWDAVARGDALIASANFMHNMHVRLGDTVTLATPSGAVQLPIAGVTSHYFSPRGTLNISRALYARLWHDKQISRAYVHLAPGADAAAVRARIAASLGQAYSLRILSGAELIDYFASRVRAAFAGVYVHSAGVLIVVLIGVAETLAAEVMARRRELATLRVVGAQRHVLRRLVMREAALLGTMGLLLASVTGLVQGALWVHATFPYLFGFVIALSIPYQVAAILALLTLAVCVLAALLPAHHAARLQPAVALRYE